MKYRMLLLVSLISIVWLQTLAFAQTECSYQEYFSHDTSLVGNPGSLTQFTDFELSYDPSSVNVYSRMSHGVKLLVAIDKSTTMTPSEQQSFANLIFNIWNRYWLIFKGFPFTEYKLLVLKNTYTDGEHGGGFYVGLPFESNISPCHTEFFSHGIYHAWLSGGDGGINPDTIVDERHKWLVEGITQYYGVKVIPLFSTGSRRKLSDIQSDFHQVMMNWLLAFYLTEVKGTPDDIPLIEMYPQWSFTSKNYIYYVKGGLVAYLMDQTLHNNGSSLDELMMELYHRFSYGAVLVTTEDVRDLCVELAGETCRAIFNNYVYGSKPLPMEWSTQFTHYKGSLDGRFVLDLPITEIILKDTGNPGLIPVVKQLLLNKNKK